MSGVAMRRLAFAGLALLAACAGGDREAGPRQLVIASTTSTEDSGLLERLLPAFAAAHPAHAPVVVAVGTGEALELGRRGDADVVLVHDPPAESAFVAAGHGVERRAVMHNDFVLVGPPSDPAGARGAEILAALRAIAAAGAPFVSRGDDSGTHRKERALWRQAGHDPAGGWYREVGQGMGEALRIASELGAYTLADRGTWLFLRGTLALELLVEGEPPLHNPYGVIPVADARNAAGAAAFAEWITGPEAQALIAGYGIERYGQPLFFPDARDR